MKIYTLRLYRRHLKKCSHRKKGREYTKCSCPIWVDGYLNGEDYRRSLNTWDWQRAIRLVERLERPNSERNDLVFCEQLGCNMRVEEGRCERHQKTISGAVEAFHKAHKHLGYGTQRNYNRAFRYLQRYFAEIKVDLVHQVDSGMIDSFRISRKISDMTWVKELEIIRRLFRFCRKRKWTSESPAADVEMPKNIKPTEKEPYQADEIIKILTACDFIGQRPYERLRARAMILLLRYTALRISDVATLTKGRVRDGEIHVRTLKNGKVVKLPVHSQLQAALDVLPEPLGSNGNSKYFFWSGNGTKRSMIRDATRTLAAVFKASGVEGAHAHRFRHTLATEILIAGGSLEDAADVLGNSPNIINKHYSKWCRGRQERISALVDAIFGTAKGTPGVHDALGALSNTNTKAFSGGRHGIRILLPVDKSASYRPCVATDTPKTPIRHISATPRYVIVDDLQERSRHRLGIFVCRSDLVESVVSLPIGA